MFEASLLPPQEKGMMWSYSRLNELPQHWQTPPSLENTIRFVVCEIFRLCEKQQTLNSISDKKRSSLFILLIASIISEKL
jgi:hypothetical protein